MRRGTKIETWVVAAALALPAGASAQTIAVTSTADNTTVDALCTLREAINNANTTADTTGGDCPVGQASPIRDVIIFNVGGTEFNIGLTSALPQITDPLEIDGTNGEPDAINLGLDGTAAGSGDGLVLQAGSEGSLLHHLAAFDFGDDGIRVAADDNTITDVNAGMAQAGTAASPNLGDGIQIEADNTTIADSAISGNDDHGIHFQPLGAGNTGAGTTITGSVIGLTKAGGGEVPNGEDGINALLQASSPPAGEIAIGGATPIAGDCDGDCNVISGNDDSAIDIAVTGGGAGWADGLTIQGNYIGTDRQGLAAHPNTTVTQDGAVKIGGAVEGAEIRDNLVSGNNQRGILLTAAPGAGSDVGPKANQVAGNIVGLDREGDDPLPNALNGVMINNSVGSGGPPLVFDPFRDNVIGGPVDPTPGGPCDGDCNLISANGGSGIALSSNALGELSGTSIIGNYVGVDRAGDVDLGNDLSGVLIADASDTQLGESGLPPNVISGNEGDGVEILGENASGNVIESNLIGTAIDGATPLANTEHGVMLWSSANLNVIGGTAAGTANVIAHSLEAGIMGGGFAGDASVDNSFLGNSIFSNGGLGIDLRPDLLTAGVTENSACDEALGANRCQQFPVVTAAAAGSAAIAGTLASDANETFRIELFANTAGDPSGNGEGERFLGAVETTTDGNGNASWLFCNSTVTVAAGELVAATATELSPGGSPLSTSEFSDVVEATAGAVTCDGDGDGGDGGDGDGDGDGGGDDVECKGKVATIVGTASAETLTGTDKADVIAALGGNDTIKGKDGSDTVCAGTGSDTAEGGGGHDTIRGEDGKDTLKGSKGDDTGEGGKGDDTLKGQGGNDTLKGGDGKDVLEGEDGKDTLDGGDGNKDDLDAGEGDDKLKGGKGSDDVCDGGKGNDKLKGDKPGCEEKQSL